RAAGLHRRRAQQAALHIVDLACVVERLAGPGLLEDVERFLERARTGRVVPAELIELGRAIALPQPDLDATAREVVDDRQVLGHAHRMAVERRQRHALADPAVRRRDREGRASDDRRRAIAVGLAVMLAGPDRMVAETTRLGGELERLAIGLVIRFAQAAMGLEAEGDAELHANALAMRPQSSIAFSWPGTSWMVNCVKPAARSASMRSLSSFSVAVNDVVRISSAEMNFFSSGFRNIRCPRWFSR